MIKKRAIVIMGGFALSAVLAACSYEEQEINYKGKVMTVTEAEELIADELEVENSGLDLEVDIFEESDD